MTVENCDPFGCKKVTSIDHNAINDLKKLNLWENLLD